MAKASLFKTKEALLEGYCDLSKDYHLDNNLTKGKGGRNVYLLGRVLNSGNIIIRKTIFLAIQKRNEQISEPKRKTNRYWKRQTHKPKSSIKKPRKNYIFRGFFCSKNLLNSKKIRTFANS